MTFQKMSDKCPMANWAQLVNVLGMIQTDSNGLILTPVYLAFRLFIDHMLDFLVEDINVECLNYESQRYGRIPRRKGVPYIECNANINDNADKLSIMLINKHFTEKLKVALELKGFIPHEKGIKVELTSKSPFDYNTIENRNKIEIMEKEIGNLKSNMTIELPAHSVTILKLTK
jgi:alpha-N-arabinofuranosidase